MALQHPPGYVGAFSRVLACVPLPCRCLRSLAKNMGLAAGGARSAYHGGCFAGCRRNLVLYLVPFASFPGVAATYRAFGTRFQHLFSFFAKRIFTHALPSADRATAHAGAAGLYTVGVGFATSSDSGRAARFRTTNLYDHRMVRRQARCL